MKIQAPVCKSLDPTSSKKQEFSSTIVDTSKLRAEKTRPRLKSATLFTPSALQVDGAQTAHCAGRPPPSSGKIGA